MSKSFRYEFTGKELYYFLFKRKKCPECGGEMIKNKCSEIVDGSRFNTVSVPLYIKRREVEYYYYLFECNECGVKYTLSDLANQ